MWSDKTKAEKECKYWDANGDGTITEEEYIAQVRKTTEMKERRERRFPGRAEGSR